jgi:hypothetical protein
VLPQGRDVQVEILLPPLPETDQLRYALFFSTQKRGRTVDFTQYYLQNDIRHFCSESGRECLVTALENLGQTRSLFARESSLVRTYQEPHLLARAIKLPFQFKSLKFPTYSFHNIPTGTFVVKVTLDSRTSHFVTIINSHIRLIFTGLQDFTIQPFERIRFGQLFQSVDRV